MLYMHCETCSTYATYTLYATYATCALYALAEDEPVRGADPPWLFFFARTTSTLVDADVHAALMVI